MLDEIFKNNRVQEEVIRLNQEQLQAGVDSNNEVIITKTAEYERKGKVYAMQTIQIKKEKGQPTDVVTLKDTGDFYNSFRVKITKLGYEITADFKAKTIKDSILENFDSYYRDTILGLDNESLAELVYETILPRLTKMIREKLNV